jgi:hypothetical protein
VASHDLKALPQLLQLSPQLLQQAPQMLQQAPQLLQQAPDAALLDILLSAVSTTVGNKGLDLPWKCFVCVVSMCMLVPLATNLALQVCVC